MFEHLRHCGALKLSPPTDPAYLFQGTSSVSTTLSSGAKNVIRSGKALASSKPKKDPLTRLVAEGSGGVTAEQRNVSVVSVDMDRKAGNDGVFGDTIAMLLPVVTREQNLLSMSEMC